MRGFRLNGWQRIGIILSVVWLVAGYFLALHLLYDHIYEWHAACLHRPDIPGLPDCDSVLNEDLADARSKETGTIAFWTLAPIVVVWLLAYAVVGLVRWVRRGFQPAS